MNLSPDEIVFNFGLLPGHYVADLGAGSGHIALALGNVLGENGLTIAVDINEQALVRINKIKSDEGLNIETVLGDVEVRGGTHLVEGAVHGVVISHTLGMLRDKSAALTEARRILKNKGGLYIVEDSNKMKEDEMKKLVEGSGFSYFSRFNAGENTYGLIFKK